MKNSILIVEDEPNLGHTLLDYLNSKGFNTELATNCNEAERKFSSLLPQIVLMDINLPDGDGISLAKSLKRLDSKDFEILFLSAQNDPQIRLESFELGGMDYLTKPFELKELRLRLDRILKNMNPESQDLKSVKYGPYTLHFDKYLIEFQDRNFQVSQKELEILRLLYQNLDLVVKREKIIENIWGSESFPSMRTVDNYIVKIRKILSNHSSKEEIPDELIESIRGVGYKLKKISELK